MKVNGQNLISQYYKAAYQNKFKLKSRSAYVTKSINQGYSIPGKEAKSQTSKPNMYSGKNAASSVNKKVSNNTRSYIQNQSTNNSNKTVLLSSMKPPEIKKTAKRQSTQLADEINKPIDFNMYSVNSVDLYA